MTKRRTSVARVGLATVGVLALGLMSACSGGSSNGNGSSDSNVKQNTLSKLKESGTITVGIADERPYSWKAGGEAKGATIAMHKKIFGEMGIKNVKVVEVDWNSLIPGLNAGRFDAISAGMSILPKRCKKASFSDPEIMYTTSLMVKKGNPKHLTDLDSVKNAGDVKLAVLAGGIEAGYAEKLGLGNLTSVDNAQDGMDTVSNGRADAFAMTTISLNWMAKKNPKAGVETTKAFEQVIDGVKQTGAGATVFRTRDPKLLKAYNTQLDKITADKSEYLDLVGEYGFTEKNLPPKDLTTKQLCAGELG